MSDVPNGSAPVAGNPAPNAGTPAATGEWYAGIADEGLRGYVQTKGFKDPASLAESYRNLEKLQGVPQDRLLKLPEKADDPAWGDVWGKLGRPEKPDGYELQSKDGGEFAKEAAAWMHEAGVPKAQAQKLNEKWNAYQDRLIAEYEAERQQRDAAELTELRGKWGAKYDANVELGRRAGREFGLSEQEFEAISSSLGSGKTLELFNRIGSKLGEARPFEPGQGGGGGGFGMTPEAARSRISSLSADRDWTAKYLKGDVNAREEMTRLQKIAAGEA